MTYLLNTVIIVFLMWILFPFGSALFAGLTTILAKCGIRKTDSDAATVIRTVIVLHSGKSASTASSPISEPPSVPGSCLLWRGSSCFEGQAAHAEGRAEKRAWLHLPVEEVGARSRADSRRNAYHADMTKPPQFCEIAAVFLALYALYMIELFCINVNRRRRYEKAQRFG